MSISWKKYKYKVIFYYKFGAYHSLLRNIGYILSLFKIPKYSNKIAQSYLIYINIKINFIDSLYTQV